MSRSNNSVQIAIATISTIIFGLIFLATIAGGFVYYSGAILMLLFVSWFTIVFICLLSALKSLRVFSTVFGLILIGLPFAFLCSYLAPGPMAVLIFTLFMTAWTLIGGFLTRSTKGVYWSLHLAGWIFGMGLWTYSAYLAAYSYNGYNYYHNPFAYLPIWLLLPLGLTIILGAQYRAVLGFLNTISFLRSNEAQTQQAQQAQQTPVQPQTLSQQAYQQGYQSGKVYEEGGQVFPYPQEQPQAQYPRAVAREQ